MYVTHNYSLRIPYPGSMVIQRPFVTVEAIANW